MARVLLSEGKVLVHSAIRNGLIMGCMGAKSIMMAFGMGRATHRFRPRCSKLLRVDDKRRGTRLGMHGGDRRPLQEGCSIDVSIYQIMITKHNLTT